MALGCAVYNNLDAFAAAGKHVILKKSLEVTVERLDEMIAACDEVGVGLAGIFLRRVSPATAVLKQAIDTCRFGRVSLAEATIK